MGVRNSEPWDEVTAGRGDVIYSRGRRDGQRVTSAPDVVNYS